MGSRSATDEAVRQGLRDALKAVPVRRMTPMEKALKRQPGEELEFATYLTRQALPKVTGKAAPHALRAWRYLKHMRAILSPELEQFRHDD